MTSKKWRNRDVAIQYTGEHITLPDAPEKMPIPDAMAHLQRLYDSENEETSVLEYVDAFPLDAAVSFIEAMKAQFGFSTARPTMGMFGPNPPQMLGVRVGPKAGDTIQVPVGAFSVPGLSSEVRCQPMHHEGRMQFIIHSNCKKSEAPIIKRLATLTREHVAENSIYRGKALRLTHGAPDWDSPPEFIDVESFETESLVLNADVRELVATNILTPIRQTEACRTHQIPLRRGVLLSGAYGVGKTLTGAITALECVANGWTYITADDCSELADILAFARRYQPCVVFAEDVDRQCGTRTDEANDILNIVDGVVSKSAELITVLTTNHVDRITPALLRPGRLDAVINVSAPDADSAETLVRLYGRGLIADSVKLDKAKRELSGMIPAAIRECVERSKLGMIARGADSVVESDLLTACTGIRHHMELVNRDDSEPSNAEKLYSALSGCLSVDTRQLDRIERIARVASDNADSAAGMSADVKEELGEAAYAARDTADNVEETRQRVAKVQQAVGA